MLRFSVTALPNAAALASKSAFVTQIFDAARVFRPVFDVSGKRAGNFCAVSAHCAKAASILAASNGRQAAHHPHDRDGVVIVFLHQ